MKKYLMMLAAGLLTVSLGGCAVVTDSSQTDSVEVEEVAEEAKDDTEKNDTEQEETDEPAWYGSWKIIDVKAAAVSALAEEEVEKYKDQTVTYGETTVMVGDTSYEIEGYAGAIYRIEGTVLINKDIFDTYLEQFHEPATGKDKVIMINGIFPIVSGIRSNCFYARRISSNFTLLQSLSSIMRFITS